MIGLFGEEHPSDKGEKGQETLSGVGGRGYRSYGAYLSCEDSGSGLRRCHHLCRSSLAVSFLCFLKELYVIAPSYPWGLCSLIGVGWGVWKKEKGERTNECALP